MSDTIAHVLANCECRHAQQGFEALREYAALKARLNDDDARRLRWLLAAVERNAERFEAKRDAIPTRQVAHHEALGAAKALRHVAKGIREGLTP